MEKPYIIGITGGSASGKTLFLTSLMKQFRAEDICLISQDNYYKAIDRVPKDENGIENFDLPDSIDFDLFAEHIQDLKAGKVVHMKEYTFNNAAAENVILEFKPAPIIVVEGIFVFTNAVVSAMLDLKVFIDAKEYIKIKRRIVRDNHERGYDLSDVLYRWENHVAPTYEKYIKPKKQYADIVVNNNDNFDNGLKIMSSYIRDILAQMNVKK
jgi:uridine kinase